jgi:hypothetical protein
LVGSILHTTVRTEGVDFNSLPPREEGGKQR